MRLFTLLAVTALLAPRIAASQPYVSAQLGIASTHWPIGPPLNGRIDDQTAGYGVDFGIAFGKRWAVELGAFDYGSFDAQGTPCAAGTACAPAVADISGTDNPIASAPRLVATLPANVEFADVTPDGQRFLAILPEHTGIGSITVVQNWRAALQHRSQR